MENPQIFEIVQEIVAALGTIQKLKDLFQNPNNLKNGLLEMVKNVPLDKLIQQIGGKHVYTVNLEHDNFVMIFIFYVRRFE